jgi:predicted mannosyl-3-phosphoglycerate phosphatase (HAD superfamily)
MGERMVMDSGDHEWLRQVAACTTDDDILSVGRAQRIVNELERLRLQLAGCGVIALANTDESLAKETTGIPEDIWCASMADVRDASLREIKERKRAEQAEARLNQLLDVLQEIANSGVHVSSGFGWIAEMAQQAIAEVQKETQRMQTCVSLFLFF